MTTPTIEEMRNATPEAMRKLATLILHRAPLQPSAVAEALETCADAWASALEQLEKARKALGSAAQTLSNLGHGDITGNAKTIALNASANARRAALPPAPEVKP